MSDQGDQAGRDRVRPSAATIYENVKHDAEEELDRRPLALAFSGLFAGGTVGFSGLAAAAAAAVVSGHGARLVGALFYPIGFVAVIVGRAQLFTENTLYPVILVFEDRRKLLRTLRLWAIVYVTNVVGAFLLALLVGDSGAVPGDVLRELTSLGGRLSTGPWTEFFWSGLLAGWLLALVAWLIEASEATIGQIALIWGATFIIGAASLSHCVSTTFEVLSAVVSDGVSVSQFFAWLGPVTFGNIVGGVLIVALLNYGQVQLEAHRSAASGRR